MAGSDAPGGLVAVAFLAALDDEHVGVHEVRVARRLGLVIHRGGIDEEGETTATREGPPVSGKAAAVTPGAARGQEAWTRSFANGFISKPGLGGFDGLR